MVNPGASRMWKERMASGGGSAVSWESWSTKWGWEERHRIWALTRGASSDPYRTGSPQLEVEQDRTVAKLFWLWPETHQKEGGANRCAQSPQKWTKNRLALMPLTPWIIWCLGPDLNRHGSHPPRDFKSLASTNSATQASLLPYNLWFVWEKGSIDHLLLMGILVCAMRFVRCTACPLRLAGS